MIILKLKKSSLMQKMLNSKFVFYLFIMTFLCLFSDLAYADKQKSKKKGIRAKIAHVAPVGSPWDLGMQEYIQNLKKNTNDKINIKYFPGGILGGELSMVRNLKRNKIQIVGGSLGSLATVVPELNAIELPFMFMTKKEVDKVFNKIMDKDLPDLLKKKGYLLLLLVDVGWRSLGTIKHKIEKADDLKGLRMRSQESEIHINMWKYLKATPQPISIIDTMTYLQAKAIDGLDNSPTWFMTTLWYHNIKYLTITEHIYQPAITVCNLKFYNSLPKDLQSQITKSSKGLAAKYTKLVRHYNDYVFQVFIDSGIEIDDMVSTERDKMKSMVQPVHKMFLESTTVDGKKLYDRIKQTLNKK